MSQLSKLLIHIFHIQTMSQLSQLLIHIFHVQIMYQLLIHIFHFQIISQLSQKSPQPLATCIESRDKYASRSFAACSSAWKPPTLPPLTSYTGSVLHATQEGCVDRVSSVC